MSATTASAATATTGQQQLDVCLVAQLCAIDPVFIGGVAVRSFAGPVRDRWLSDLRAMLDGDVAWRAVPVHVDDDRLLGGIDLAATLQTGRPVAQRGLLAEADGGVLLLAMAERMAGATAAHVAAALDTGIVSCARDGIAARMDAAFGVVALDESNDDDAPMNAALRDRLAFEVDLRAMSHRDCAMWPAAPDRAAIANARRRLPDVVVGDAIVEALCAAALALGVWSLRASVQVVRAARLLAALDSRVEVDTDDAALAARLVLAPRATRLPQPAADPDAHPEAARDAADDDGKVDDAQEREDHRMDDAADRGDTADADDPEPTSDVPEAPPDADAADRDAAAADPADDIDPHRGAPMEDAVIAAAAAAIPAGLLARIVADDAASRSRGAAGRVGAMQASRRRGRPAGVRRDRPSAGARLDLMATLRAAVPWQCVRGRAAAGTSGRPDGRIGRAPIRIRAEDFHVGRFKQRGRTTTIFAVDASGSSALHRLAEAKGAVELLLADCYVRRDSVAVVGFRGRAAELLLPPTRSLVRAKRSLAELPGGGGTPLAAGFDAAAMLADAVRRRGDSAVVVILSDGRANVARDGGPGRPRAEADARVAARALRDCGAATIFVDTSAQPHPLARELAGLMGGRYLFLPHAEAATLSAAVRSAAPAISTAR